MFLREAETDHNFANEMEFMQSHHAANNEPFVVGPAATVVLAPGHQHHHLHHPGSVGSIEANIPSSLCVEDDPDVPEPADHQHHHLDQSSLGVLRLQDLAASPVVDEDEEVPQVDQDQSCSPATAAGVNSSSGGGAGVNVQSSQLVGEFGAGFWVDDMAGFPLPPLDLDPLPPGLFSPCSGTYNWGCSRSDCMPRLGNINGEGMADVLLSLKHAVVHPGSPTGGYYSTGPPVVATGAHVYAPTQDYGQGFGPATGNPPSHYAQGPAMSVNVSMNMTMNMNMHPGHGYESGGQNYATSSSSWGVEPLLSPAPQYSGLEQHQRVNQAAANSLAAVNPHQHQHHHHHHPQQHNSSSHHHHHHQLDALCEAGPGTPPSSRSSLGGQIPQDDQIRPNLCKICGKTYARPSTLKTHLRTHSGEKPFRCHACSKAFSQAANLTAHTRTHSGEKPFSCPVCDRKFSQSSSVTTHMRTHSGERPYSCKDCRKAFSDSSTLTKHLRTHSGEKPYQCKICLLRFSQSGNLNRHLKVHTSSLT